MHMRGKPRLGVPAFACHCLTRGSTCRFHQEDEEVTDTLEQGPEGLYKRPPY